MKTSSLKMEAAGGSDQTHDIFHLTLKETLFPWGELILSCCLTRCGVMNEPCARGKQRNAESHFPQWFSLA